MEPETRKQMAMRRANQCYANFHNNHLEQIVSNYPSMLSKGIKHFIYYEPGALFIGWLERQSNGFGFRAKWLTNPNEEYINGFFLQMYHQIGLKKAILFDEFHIAKDEREMLDSPLDRVIKEPTYLKIEKTEGYLEKYSYPILQFSDTLEQKAGN